ncbi:DUF4349 domain-containing protein [Mucilaginibacter flavus]|uniref:DUF4349 domain-containing protein n=1 Tax=Mucilaginibacter flavus TaxID=931504 RepID=UPI0025B30E72|nr:DUF4349 domain-containing protein [Mucilaginibacter flavus]MDN3583493.1 DUF4349 domain-containing protein [Mucilaginibacter flavus]
MKISIISLVLLSALMACNRAPDEKLKVANVELMAPPEGYKNRVAEKAMDKTDARADSKAPVNIPVDTAKKIVKEGEIRFESKNLKATRDKILVSLKSLGGYVGEENETNNGDNNRREYDLKIRVPSKNFDRFLDTLSSNADHIDAKNIRVKDVTTEFIDITTQLKNKQLLENRYLELLKRATKTSDLLEIEDKLESIRTDIETTQGQLNYLNSQVAFSSLDITFYNIPTAERADEQFNTKFKNAVAEGWDILKTLFFDTIMLWPVIFIGFVGVWVYRKRKRNRRVENGDEQK